MPAEKPDVIVEVAIDGYHSFLGTGSTSRPAPNKEIAPSTDLRLAGCESEGKYKRTPVSAGFAMMTKVRRTQSQAGNEVAARSRKREDRAVSHERME